MLSTRLQEIASYVKRGSIVADIGCDHAWLSIFLVKNNICTKAIASDVNQGPIDNAKRNIKDFILQDKIDARLGSGLNTIKPYEADVCVISGMGGSLIKTILEDSYEVTKTFDRIICQPNNSEYQLRKYMTRIGFKIVGESIVKDNDVLYEVICFEKGKHEYSEQELKYGPFLLKEKSDLFIEKCKLLIEKNNFVLKQLPTSQKEKINYFEKENSLLNNILQKNQSS